MVNLTPSQQTNLRGILRRKNNAEPLVDDKRVL